uniref:Peptidase n=1 Tax=viral metagenome TaxID=1070528 RepID=A0A6M3J381_9ZZZZ
MKDFELFQAEFKKWQYRFGLTGYKVYFKHEPLDESFANILINQGGMVATVTLNSKVPDKDKPHKDIKRSAKHEALHLLVGRLEQDGRYRYSSENEIYEATEELIFRLEELISEKEFPDA